ncbi:MAG: DUF4157 domain-containing protein [Desulfatitalea sp.]|nr:DUF4157 domain-containing protein [Desulfatitalea sp.]
MNSKAEISDRKKHGASAKAAAKRDRGKSMNHSRIPDHRKAPVIQSTLQMMIDHGSRQTVQREMIRRAFDTQVQLKGPEKEALLQGKFTAQRAKLEDEDLMQGKFAVQKKENKTGLPDGLKTGIENLSSMSLDNVRVHANSSRPATVGAHAYTQGTNIHVAPGQLKHLPHEAWHAVQQMQGRVQATGQIAGMLVNDSTALEKEADLMGAKAV